MLVVPDTTDVYCPLAGNVVVNLKQSRELVSGGGGGGWEQVVCVPAGMWDGGVQAQGCVAVVGRLHVSSAPLPPTPVPPCSFPPPLCRWAACWSPSPACSRTARSRRRAAAQRSRGAQRGLECGHLWALANGCWLHTASGAFLKVQRILTASPHPRPLAARWTRSKAARAAACTPSCARCRGEERCTCGCGTWGGLPPTATTWTACCRRARSTRWGGVGGCGAAARPGRREGPSLWQAAEPRPRGLLASCT